MLDSHSPYALSYFNEDIKTKEKKTFHLQIYWNDEFGYTLDNDINSTDEEPLPRLRYLKKKTIVISSFSYFVEQHLRPGSVRYDVDDDVSIREQIRECKVRVYNCSTFMRLIVVIIDSTCIRYSFLLIGSLNCTKST